MKKLFLCLALLLPATPVLAHAHLETSTPADGAKIKSPQHVVLSFSEALEPAFSGAELTDQKGHAVSAPAKTDGTMMTLTPGPLPPGRYHVSWHAVAHDTHRTQGSFSFSVLP